MNQGVDEAERQELAARWAILGLSAIALLVGLLVMWLSQRALRPIRTLTEAAQRLGVRHRDILSQAGHDAYYVSRIAPTAMIFTPCRDGISHNEAEHAEEDYTVPGVNVLLEAVLARANR